MKKLMFAAAAALCATVGYSIDSANIVGYQSIPLQAGYTIFAPTFDGVGQDQALDIQNIKLKNVPGDGTDLIWILGTDGMITGEMYYWFAEDTMGEEAGWSEDGETYMTRAIPAGEGFYFYTEAEGAEAQVSGQVKIGEFSKDLEVGYNLTGNFSPIARDIQTIKLVGVPGDGTDLIWVLGSDGMVTGEMWYWFAEDTMGEEAGWSEDGESYMVKQIQPGEGFYFYTEATGAKIKIPAIAIK